MQSSSHAGQDQDLPDFEYRHMALEDIDRLIAECEAKICHAGSDGDDRPRYQTGDDEVDPNGDNGVSPIANDWVDQSSDDSTSDDSFHPSSDDSTSEDSTSDDSFKPTSDNGGGDEDAEEKVIGIVAKGVNVEVPNATREEPETIAISSDSGLDRDDQERRYGGVDGDARCERCQEKSLVCLKPLPQYPNLRACRCCNKSKTNCVYPSKKKKKKKKKKQAAAVTEDAAGDLEAIDEDALQKTMDAYGARLELIESGLAKALVHAESVKNTQVEILGLLANLQNDWEAVKARLGVAE